MIDPAERARVLRSRANLAWESGDITAAQRYAEGARDAASARAYAASAEQVGQMFASSAWQAMAESAAGSLALAEGDAVAARDRFTAAHQLDLRAGQPYWAQRVAPGNGRGTHRS
jgi:hypothetical protein